jgi:prepilin-type N-terminal cleavage/methylation domain-containing protein
MLKKNRKGFTPLESSGSRGAINDSKRTLTGFTIIEVLIVLAIAGLIMLIVFLAVPALQRNSRNTQRKNDIADLIGAIQEYSSNNSGQLPKQISDAVANTKLGFYAAGDITGSLQNTNPLTASLSSSGSGVNVENYAKCGALPAANVPSMPTDPNPTTRNIAAVYRTELASGFQVQCQDM